MYLREDMIQRYLASSRPASFDLACLEDDVAATETLRASRVIDIWCFRSGVHEFLVVQLESPKLERKFWMRLDRMPELSRAALRISQRAAPAHDAYSLNYDYDTLVLRESKKKELVEALTQLSQAPSMVDLVLLMNIIRDVSKRWHLLGTNCRWFCAVTLDSLQRQFGGKWMVDALHRGIGNFRGFQEPATMRVRELYQPWFQPGQHPGVPAAIVAAGAIPVAVVNISPGIDGAAPKSPPEDRTEQGDERDQPGPQPHAYMFTETGNTGRLESMVCSFVNPNIPELEEEVLVRKILVMQALHTPREIWDCFRQYLAGPNGHTPVIQIQRLLKLSRLWAHRCRVPGRLLAEIRTAFHRVNLDSLQRAGGPSRELSINLTPTTIFGLNKPTDSWRHNTEDILGVSPERTAGLLRSMEVEIRSVYLEAEVITCYSWHCGPSNTTEPVQSILPFAETVIIWVKACFMSAEDSKMRIAVFSHFEKVARECYKRHNYATTISIVTALTELKIHTLKVTLKRVGEKNVKALDKLKSDCRRHQPGSNFPRRSPAPVFPLCLSARRETLQLLEALKSDQHGTFNTEDLLNRICPPDTVNLHRMKPESVKPELLGCSALLLSSMEDGCRKWDRLKDPNNFTQIQDDERAERDRVRSIIVY